MKKVLALVLAVMMMATVAMAAEIPVVNDASSSDVAKGQKVPGGKIKIDMDTILADAATVGVVYDSDPNSTAVTDGTAKLIKKINSTNYSISAIKYDEGKNLVESVKFSDTDDQVVIKLKDDFTNTSQKTLNMTFSLKGKKVGKTKPAEIDLRVKYIVGYALETWADKINDANDTIKIDNNDDLKDKVVKFEQGDNQKATYATLELTSADTDVEVEFRVYDGDKFFLYSKVDADNDVLKAYADTDADITFLTFPATPTLNSTATVRFYKEEGTYFYINNDGKLVDISGRQSAGSAMDLTSKVNWDEDEGCYILKTRTLGAYVISDKKLNVAAGSTADNIGATTNPDTGANDVVGIATALAAVALVSAAAVSLKK